MEYAGTIDIDFFVALTDDLTVFPLFLAVQFLYVKALPSL